jgi:hypothetical protein
VPQARKHRAPLRTVVLVVLLAVVGLAASGCVRVHAAFAVSSDDRVSGDLIVGTQPSAQNDAGPQLTVPPSLASKVTGKPYSADGYVGTELTFTGLTFTELSELATTASTLSGAYHLQFQRSSDLVTLAGSADLSQVSTTKADVQLKVSFPGQVLRTDGDLAGQTVSWTLTPNRITSFSAADQYTIGNTHGWRFWALAVGGGGAIASLMVVGLALLARRHNLRKERAYAASQAMTG